MASPNPFPPTEDPLGRLLHPEPEDSREPAPYQAPGDFDLQPHCQQCQPAGGGPAAAGGGSGGGSVPHAQARPRRHGAAASASARPSALWRRCSLQGTVRGGYKRKAEPVREARLSSCVLAGTEAGTGGRAAGSRGVMELKRSVVGVQSATAWQQGCACWPAPESSVHMSRTRSGCCSERRQL